jgi:hypothetical protein
MTGVRRPAGWAITSCTLATACSAPAGAQLELAAPQRGVTSEFIASDDRLGWFEAEHKIMLLAGKAAGALAWQQPWIMTCFLNRRGYWQDWATAQHAALAAATRLDDQAGQARARHSVGQARIRLRDYVAGLEHLRRALELYAQLGEREHQAHVHICCCVASDMQHDHADTMAVPGRQ